MQKKLSTTIVLLLLFLSTFSTQDYRIEDIKLLKTKAGYQFAFIFNCYRTSPIFFSIVKPNRIHACVVRLKMNKLGQEDELASLKILPNLDKNGIEASFHDSRLFFFQDNTLCTFDRLYTIDFEQQLLKEQLFPYPEKLKRTGNSEFFDPEKMLEYINRMEKNQKYDIYSLYQKRNDAGVIFRDEQVDLSVSESTTVLGYSFTATINKRNYQILSNFRQYDLRTLIPVLLYWFYLISSYLSKSGQSKIKEERTEKPMKENESN